MLEALDLAGGGVLDLDAPVPGLEAQKRSGTQEAIAAQALAADDAFEQKSPIALLDLAEGGYRGEGIADELAIDRHQAVG